MAEPGQRQRTVLRAPRVDFDLSALALGAGGWLAYQCSWPALATILQVPEVQTVPSAVGLRWAFFGKLFGWMGLPYTEWLAQLVGWPAIRLMEGDKHVAYALNVPWWQLVVVGAWLLVLWSIVAGAICRVYAVRIARDESISAGDGLAFAFSNLRSFVTAPLFVAAAIGLVLGLAALVGALIAVPFAGPFLEIALHPLALVAGLIATVFAVGGLFGLPVMQAAIATERNGTLDAISRTFSYVFTRPVAYVVSASLVTVVSGILIQFGHAFIVLSSRALAFGASWNSDPSTPMDAERGMGRGISHVLQGGVLSPPSNLENVEGLAVVWIYVAWAFTAIAAIAVSGFVLSYFVGGLTDTYFLLRREVDGIEDLEVYMEGEEATFGEPLPGEPTEPPAKPA